eukprot:m.727191 g.727191  ORF g.727191 m.727191 type:complete len:504 (-) comp23032_c0_seq4:1085-2596(-)
MAKGNQSARHRGVRGDKQIAAGDIEESQRTIHSTQSTAKKQTWIIVAVAAFLLWINLGSNPSSDSDLNEPTDPDDRLFYWATYRHDVDLSNVRIGVGSKGRGLFTTKAVKKGTELYNIPETMWISKQTIARFSNFATVAADEGFQSVIHERDDDTRELLAWTILYELGNTSSYWAPYLESLPKFDVAEPPLFYWNEDQLNELQSPRVIETAKRQLSVGKEAYQRGVKYLELHFPYELAKCRAFDETSWLWAYYMVKSRAFNCELPPSPGDTETVSIFHKSHTYNSCMIPIIDLANTDLEMTNDNTMILEMPAKKAYYSCRAPKKIKKGKEVLQSYAGDPSEKLPVVHYFMVYGYAIEDIRERSGDYITIKLANFSDEDSSDEEAYWMVSPEGFLPTGLRAATMKLGYDDVALVPRIVQSVDAALASMATTLEHDIALLQEPMEVYWKRCALIIRIRAKQALNTMKNTLVQQTTEAIWQDLPRLPVNVNHIRRLPANSLFSLEI